MKHFIPGSVRLQRFYDQVEGFGKNRWEIRLFRRLNFER